MDKTAKVSCEFTLGFMLQLCCCVCLKKNIGSCIFDIRKRVIYLEFCRSSSKTLKKEFK